MKNYTNNMMGLASKLFPICRSLTGDGVRQTLDILKKEIGNELVIKEISSGSQVFDWTIPKEWNITAGYIKTLDGKTIIDFSENNLYVIGYSTPIKKRISKQELLEHIYTLPNNSEWVPYVTSYYTERWGFCMSENQKKTLVEEEYDICINTSLTDGFLNYGEVILPGESQDEIFFSTYICHPSMANNELSGPVVTTELIKYIKNLPERRYTYRFVFIPETIGSIAYLSYNLQALKQNVKAGFVVTCVGDDRTYSYVASRYGNTLADKVAKNTLQYHYPEYKAYSFLERGSDERQYCAPGVDLPVCSICRTKYGEYPEYHTSADNLSLISEDGLNGALQVYVKICQTLENNFYYKVNCLCEPQLGKRGLYPTLSIKNGYGMARIMTNFIAYSDGTNDLIDISNIISTPVDVILPMISPLVDNKLISK